MHLQKTLHLHFSIYKIERKSYIVNVNIKNGDIHMASSIHFKNRPEYEEIQKLVRNVAFDADLSDVEVGRFGYTIEIGDDVNPDQVVQIIRTLKYDGVWDNVDELVFNKY